MRLFLIRHGETVDNVAGNYAGITDSALTNHGVLQANRLGAHFAAAKGQVSHIFSSDLQRAFRTAEAIREAQEHPPSKTTQLEVLREQDFGFYEGKQFFERPKEGNKSGKDAHLEAHRNDSGFRDVESKERMGLRMETFVDEHLVQLLHDADAEKSVVIVAHGIILNHLWRAILKRFSPSSVSVLPGVQTADRGFSLEYLGGWSNTGFLELEVKPKQKVLDQTPHAEVSSPTLETVGLVKPSSPGVSLDKVEPSTISADVEESSPAADAADPVNPTLTLGEIEAGTIPGDVVDSTTQPTAPQQPVTSPLSNTSSTPSKLLDMTLLIMAVNSQAHLKGLKKTRGGIGNLKHDSKQKTMDSFFKKRRLE